MSQRPRFENLVRGLLTLLARREFATAARIAGGPRFDAAALTAAVADHGRPIAEPPADAPIPLEAQPVPGADPPTWTVRTPLWTAASGWGDLTLTLTVRAVGPAGYHVEITDLHVR